jgi:tripartite-type tricarboxylate transporter receptor subunit TctC
MLQHIQAGKLRALGVSSKARAPSLPDVPPIREAVPGYEVTTWYSFVAPAGTPKAIVDRLNSEFIKASREPQLAARLQESGVLTRTATPEELRKLMRAEVEVVGPLVKSLGMAPN